MSCVATGKCTPPLFVSYLIYAKIRATVDTHNFPQMNTTTGIQQVEDAYEAYFISQCIILALICLVLPYEVWGYLEFEVSKKCNTQQRMLRRSLFLNAVFVTMLESLSLCISLLGGLTKSQCSGLSISLTYALLFFQLTQR